MCYSAQIEANYATYVRMFGATMSIKEFVRVFWWHEQEGSAKIPKAMEAAFTHPRNDDEAQAKGAIDKRNTAQALKFEQVLFEQRTRLNAAERELQAKPTKKASESKRIAANKIEQAMGKLADLRRTGLLDRDSRIFPGHYAPVMVVQDGQRVVMPMRYQCRPAGKPAFYDTKFPGTFNARRDNLEGFWKGQFGHTHGLVLMDAFFENVPRHKAEGRELCPGEEPENVILQFKPRTGGQMLVGCLWSRWTAPGEQDLLSFAAITDEPPAEVAAAGHDRCIIPIKPENIDAWLNPDPKRLADAYAVLDDREQPYYEHLLAA